MWTCPKCTRTFRNTNQAHTCKLALDHFDEQIKKLAERILRVNYRCLTAVAVVGKTKPAEWRHQISRFTGYLGVNMKKLSLFHIYGYFP